eukprot:COSAG02_NODE_63507_length_263_cov_0.621951_2_plen_31_part_01
MRHCDIVLRVSPILAVAKTLWLSPKQTPKMC